MNAVLLGRICRTCLKKSAGMRKLFEFIKDDLRIEAMLNETIPNFDMEMDDVPLPVEICKECLSKLQRSYDFVQMCANSNKELKSILVQQEQEVESSTTLEVYKMETLEETDILLDSCKKELDDNNSSANRQASVEDLETETVKLEIEMQNESHCEDDSSSDEYWPNDDKDNSDSNFFEKIQKDSADVKPKRQYNRNMSIKRVNTKICLHCNKAFIKRDLLLQHLSVHDSENQYVCDICDYRFSSERKLNTHMNRKHTEVEKSLAGGPYPCSDCPMIFERNRDLAEHRNTHSERDFKCQICDQSFSLEHLLNDHINEHMGYKRHKCNFCEKGFPNNTALKDHIRIHTGESPFLCPHCGKSFKTANVLRQHIQRHGEKKFHCPECPMKFYVKVNLTQHMTSHSKLKPHLCDICGSAFTRQDSLKAHKFKHSGERPFKCEDCNKSFVFKRHLQRHKITHTGEKPHMCSFCDRAFAASGDLVKHLRKHVGEKTYFCDQCPKSFKYKLDLKDHKNLHYKEKLNLEQKNIITIEIPNEDIEMHGDESVVTLEELYEVDKNSE